MDQEPWLLQFWREFSGVRRCTTLQCFVLAAISFVLGVMLFN